MGMCVFLLDQIQLSSENDCEGANAVILCECMVAEMTTNRIMHLCSSILKRVYFIVCFLLLLSFHSESIWCSVVQRTG